MPTKREISPHQCKTSSWLQEMIIFYQTIVTIKCDTAPNNRNEQNITDI